MSTTSSVCVPRSTGNTSDPRPAAYFAELDRRMATGYDPERALPVTPAQMAPPYGLLLVARRGGEPIGCGALKFPREFPDEPTPDDPDRDDPTHDTRTTPARSRPRSSACGSTTPHVGWVWAGG